MSVAETTSPKPDEQIAETRRALAEARHLPGRFYNAPDIYDLEKQRIFLKDWLCVARADEIENPGDYMTVQVMDERVILARDAERRINAFSNVCRHRGVAVAQGSGHTDIFTCPYHSWTYDLTGQLIAAPYMDKAEKFDVKSCRLHPVGVDLWAGWVFINFDPAARPLADFVARLDADYGFLRQGELRLAAKFRAEVDCNWKFFQENDSDFYHVYTTHTETFGPDFPAPEDFRPALAEDGGFTAFYSLAYSSVAPHFDALPGMEDKSPDFAAWAGLPPNAAILGQRDHIQALIIWPLAADRCAVDDYTLVHPREFEREGFEGKVKDYADFFEKIIREDAKIVVSQQKALTSVGFAPGFVAHEEQAVHRFANYYLERLFDGD